MKTSNNVVIFLKKSQNCTRTTTVVNIMTKPNLMNFDVFLKLPFA